MDNVPLKNLFLIDFGKEKLLATKYILMLVIVSERVVGDLYTF